MDKDMETESVILKADISLRTLQRTTVTSVCSVNI